VRADRFAHGTVTAVVPQRGDLPHQPGGGHDHGPVVLPLVQPVLDLAGLEVGNGLQIGKGFALDLRLVNLEHDEAGQGDERGRAQRAARRAGRNRRACSLARRRETAAASGDRTFPIPAGRHRAGLLVTATKSNPLAISIRPCKTGSSTLMFSKAPETVIHSAAKTA
jgi:hypothetical protein